MFDTMLSELTATYAEKPHVCECVCGGGAKGDMIHGYLLSCTIGIVPHPPFYIIFNDYSSAMQLIYARESDSGNFIQVNIEHNQSLLLLTGYNVQFRF